MQKYKTIATISLIGFLAYGWYHDAKAGMHNTKLLERTRRDRDVFMELTKLHAKTLNDKGIVPSEFEMMIMNQARVDLRR